MRVSLRRAGFVGLLSQETSSSQTFEKRSAGWYIQSGEEFARFARWTPRLRSGQALEAAVPTLVSSLLKFLKGIAMGVSAEFLPEFDAEMSATRRTLERIPEDKLSWKPHEKSMPLGRLAGHIAELPGMGVRMMKDDALDFAKRPAGELAPKPTVVESQKHVLELFDKNVAALRAGIAGASDEHWGKNWKLSMGEKTFYEGPRMG